MAARRWYAHLTGLAVDALAALTASRILRTNASGVIEVNGALTSGKLVRADGTGSLADDTGVVNADVGASAAIAVNKLAAQTASRAAVFDASGFLTASALTSANLANVAHTVSDTSSINLTLSSGTLSGVVESDGVTTAMLQAQAGGIAQNGNQGSLGLSASYGDIAAHGLTVPRTSSRVLVIGIAFNVHTSGNATYAIRRGSTVIGDENAYGVSAPVIMMASDTGQSGSITYNISGKTSGSATAILGKVAVIILN